MRLAMAMHKGVGLAANQLGHTARMFVWNDGRGNKGTIINPRGDTSKDARLRPPVVDQEGCLSIPGKYFPIPRLDYVRLHGLDLEGNKVTYTAEGFLARIFQHEMDHLSGLTILDRYYEEKGDSNGEQTRKKK